MGDETQGGKVRAASGGQRGVDIAVPIHAGVSHPQLLELPHQHLPQNPLLSGAGAGAGFGVGLGIQCSIAQKALPYGFHYGSSSLLILGMPPGPVGRVTAQELGLRGIGMQDAENAFDGLLVQVSLVVHVEAVLPPAAGMLRDSILQRLRPCEAKMASTACREPTVWRRVKARLTFPCPVSCWARAATTTKRV